jgi:single-strand DNA-binding protein
MKESPKLIGKIIVLAETQDFPSGFQKRQFVIETDEKYPQKIKFEAIKDGCTRLDSYKVGDKLSVSYNLRGNEYNGKYYVSAQAWKFERVGGAERPGTPVAPRGRSADQNGAPPPASPHQQAKSNGYAPPAGEDEEEWDDVPF